MITSRALGYSYGPDKDALRGLDFTLDRGLTLGLAGANGVGKSTLLCLLAGLYSPTSGTLIVHGRNVADEAGSLRGLAALVPQEADLFIIGSTVDEDLCLGLPLSRRNEALDLARRLGLPGPSTPVHHLSHGQKRKLCLASALLNRPALLLLDEPFAGLDYPGTTEIRTILRSDRREGLTQVVAVHDLEPLADHADLWLVLDKGLQAGFGSAAEIFPGLERLGVRAPCSWRAGLGILPWEGAK